MKKFWFFFCLLLYAFCNCQAFKVYFEHEDMWEDPEVILKDEKYQNLQWIYPGTKWCGTGNVAENENDFGTEVTTDICCRDHDFCDDIIEAGQTKHNLTNNSFYTKLNCKCDELFYDCLKSSDLKSSKTVGSIYFNVLGTQCYRKDFPIVRCVKYHRFLKTRCVEYEMDLNAPQVWQWFDVPPF